MAISRFVFSSANLPRLKAKQLFKAFPFLKLSTAQEATARALGYPTWYDCTKRGTVGEPSVLDQEAGLHARVDRYYHQACVLMQMGITPSEADNWVRAWGLTGRPTLAREEAIPLYYRWDQSLHRLERGEISEDQLVQQWRDPHSKYPEIERPQRVCPGVILGPCGRYPHYAVDPAIHARIPVYLRGPSSLYHYEDRADVLAMTVPGFPDPAIFDQPLVERLNRLHHEWHYGAAHPSSQGLCLAKLEAAALAVPDAMVVVSQRAMPVANGQLDFEHYALACLRGRDFAAFLRAKGALDPEKVVWYRNIPVRRLGFDWGMWLTAPNFDGKSELPVFADADKHTPSQPIYSYPFMTAPMHADEYSAGHESICLLPLDQDYAGHEDDEGKGDEDDSWGDVDLGGPALLH